MGGVLMQQEKPRLMRQLVYDNRWHFLAALICTVFTVAIEFITPVILAETLDYYLQGKPSRMPGFVNACLRTGHLLPQTV